MSFIAKVTQYLPFGAFTIFKFPKPSTCGENLNFCQPTEQEDDVAFQFLASETDNLVQNGDFGTAADPSVTGWTFTGWSIDIETNGNRRACQVASSNTLSQKGILTVNDFYRVTVTVSNFQGGVLSIGAGTGSALFNGVLTIQSDGTFTGFFQYTEPAGAGDFIIQMSTTAPQGTCIDDVEVINIAAPSDYTVQIHDAVTFALIDTVPFQFITINQNVITVSFNWEDDVSVPNGCVVFRIFDSNDIFQDTFASNQGWVFVGDVSITSGQMRFLASGIIQPTPATIANVFTIGESYDITYDVVSILGSGASVQVQCGKTNGTIRTTSGTFVETLICTTTTDLTFRFRGVILSTINLDNVFIKKTDNLDGQSECLELETSHDCTLLWKWSNNESWGSFDYSLGFEHKLRLTCKFRGRDYPSNTNFGEDSAGLKTVDYSTLRRVKKMDIDFAGDHIHDAIAAHFMQDNRLIDDVSYILEDEYEPSSPNDSVVKFKDLMTATIELEESDQPKQINRNV